MEVGKIVFKSLQNSSGVKQLFLTEVPLLSSKKAKLFPLERIKNFIL